MKIFTEARKDMKVYEVQREELIRSGRDVLKASKAAIYAIHRDDVKQAKKLLARVKSIKRGLDKKIRKTPELLSVGAWSDALEEYAEAETFLAFHEGRTLPGHRELGMSVDTYLKGVCDLTGELGRKAVNAVINGRPEQALDIKMFVDELYGQLIGFDFRNSSLRVKFDRIKYTIERLEGVALKITLRQ